MKKFILFFTLLIIVNLSGLAQEQIDNEGAITIKAASSLAPNAGTMEYRSGQFRGYDGVNWKNLDNPQYFTPPPSFAYAWLSDTAGIPANQWTKIPFNMVHFDFGNEFIPAIPGGLYSEGSFFPVEPGFYQVTARCEYEVLDYEPAEDIEGGFVNVEPRSYVSIAVFTGMPDLAGSSPWDDHMYSQGNNLQIAFGPDDLTAIGEPLNRNNAPNVGTIVEVLPEQSISIYGFWYQPSGIRGTGFMPFMVAHDPGSGGYADESPVPETMGPPPIVPDKSKVYVTIHKVFP